MAEPARACEGDTAEAAAARDRAAQPRADDFEPLDVQDDWVREDAARSRADDFEPLDVQDDWVREDTAQAERFEPLDLESLGESGAPSRPLRRPGRRASATCSAASYAKRRCACRVMFPT